jgi:hypothetical protein
MAFIIIIIVPCQLKAHLRSKYYQDNKITLKNYGVCDVIDDKLDKLETSLILDLQEKYDEQEDDIPSHPSLNPSHKGISSVCCQNELLLHFLIFRGGLNNRKTCILTYGRTKESFFFE